ncbi:MAG: hypothetical protein KHW84_18170 [Enterobacter cloacae]|nr:hypothetical protein [Enterobacter cloacae]
MSDFIDDFFEAENALNENTRFLINESHQNGLSWPMYEKHEKDLNNYFYKVKKMLSSRDIDFYTLLRSKDAEVRMVAIKLIKDGLLDVSSSVMKALFMISIAGNDEEKLLAFSLISLRNWLQDYEGIMQEVLSELYNEPTDYYLFESIAKFLFILKGKKMLIKHVQMGLASKDEDILELANEYMAKL